MGVEYGRGATAMIINDGPALGPLAVKKMFPNAEWVTVTPDEFDPTECARDRFGENFKIQQKIYAATPTEPHIMIGGDHSVNFGHFAALADRVPDDDLCLIYIDAHLDAHTPETSRAQASGAPHGTNVRALTGDGDARWLSLQEKRPALRPENIFFLCSRSYEAAEIEFVKKNNIYMRNPAAVMANTDETIAEIRSRIGNKPYVVSFDMDAIDPKYFSDVLVPESNGIDVATAEKLTRAFAPNAHSFEFVEYAPTGDKSSHDIMQRMIEIAAE